MHKGFVFAKNSILALFLTAVVFSVVLIGGVSAATDMTIISPTAGENIKGSYNIQWTFTGTPQGPVKIQYYDGSWHDLTQVPQGSTSYTWDTIIRPDGTNYQLYVYERDTTADDISGIFTIDNNPPTSSANSPGEYQNTAIFDVPYTASDATSGVKEVELFYSKDGGSWTSYGIFTSSPISFDSSTTGGDGDYDFYTVATDNAGNVESKAPAVEASTTVDTTNPTTDDDAPSGWQTSTFTVTLTWYDPDPSSGEDWTK